MRFYTTGVLERLIEGGGEKSYSLGDLATGLIEQCHPSAFALVFLASLYCEICALPCAVAALAALDAALALLPHFEEALELGPWAEAAAAAGKAPPRSGSGSSLRRVAFLFDPAWVAAVSA